MVCDASPSGWQRKIVTSSFTFGESYVSVYLPPHECINETLSSYHSKYISFFSLHFSGCKRNQARHSGLRSKILWLDHPTGLKYKSKFLHFWLFHKLQAICFMSIAVRIHTECICEILSPVLGNLWYSWKSSRDCWNCWNGMEEPSPSENFGAYPYFCSFFCREKTSKIC